MTDFEKLSDEIRMAYLFYHHHDLGIYSSRALAQKVQRKEITLPYLEQYRSRHESQPSTS